MNFLNRVLYRFGYSGKLNRLEGDETPPGEAAGAQTNPIFTAEEMAEKLREEARKAKEVGRLSRTLYFHSLFENIIDFQLELITIHFSDL